MGKARPHTARRLGAVVAAAALACALGAGPAWAYFTATSLAEGGITLGLQPATDLVETYGQRVKHVTVTNDANATAPVFVRARVFSAQPVQVAGAGWAEAPDADGWYGYGAPVAPGSATEALDVTIEFPVAQAEDNPAGAAVGDNFNVVVVYESTPVRYDAQGNAYADWSLVLDEGAAEGGR